MAISKSVHCEPRLLKGGNHVKNFSLQIVPLLVHMVEPGSWPGSFFPTKTGSAQRASQASELP
jgi:hypothetical protein